MDTRSVRLALFLAHPDTRVNAERPGGMATRRTVTESQRKVHFSGVGQA